MHDEYTRLLSDFMDGGLPLQLRSAVTRHLVQCSACRAALGDIRLIVLWARALPAPPLERDLWPGIVAALATRSRPSGRVIPSDPDGHRGQR